MRINEKHLCAFATSNAPIDKEGHLLKKGEVNKAYQRRWFVLKGNLLFYFEKKGDKEPIGVIVLEGCTVELSESVDGFAFQICFEGSGSRSYVLVAETQGAMEKWMKAITCAGYDYMKHMVNQLQSQLDELTATDKQKQARVPSQTQHELAQHNTVLRHSNTESGSDHKISTSSSLLVDLSDSNEHQQSVINKRKGRVNPFDSLDTDSEKFKTLEAFEALHFHDLQENSGARDFLQMHRQFGDYIMKKMRECEN